MNLDGRNTSGSADMNFELELSTVALWAWDQVQSKLAWQRAQDGRARSRARFKRAPFIRDAAQCHHDSSRAAC